MSSDRTAESKGSCFFARRWKKSWLPEWCASLKNETMDKVQARKIVSVNFSHAFFSLLSTYDDLAMLVVVWLRMD
jgi:hypothetical protein